MQESWIRPIECPYYARKGEVVVAYPQGQEPIVRAFASPRAARRELERLTVEEGCCEGFTRPVAFPGPTAWILMWRGDDLFDVHLRVFETRVEAMHEWANLLEADTNDLEAARDAATLRLMAIES